MAEYGFNAVHDHLYPQNTVNYVEQDVVGDYGDSEFLSSIKSKEAKGIWLIMDELMSVIKLINPKLYTGVISKIE